MVAVVSTVNVYAGDTLDLMYRIKQGPTEETAAPVDLTDWTFTSEWRPSRLSRVAIGLSIDQSDRANGVIHILADSDQTALMGQSGVFDLQGVNGSIVHTWFMGATRWRKDVTHD